MTPSLAQRLAPASLAAQQWWQALGRRERMALWAAAVAVGVFLLWSAAIAPAWRTLTQAPAEREALEAQWQEMQRLAAEVQTLRGAAPVSPDQARVALQAATARLGERGKLQLQGPRAVLALKSVGSPELAAWLTEARVGARARVAEAALTQSATGPGQYDGSITLTLGAAP